MKLKLILLWLFFQGSIAFAQGQNFPSARPLGFILPSYYEKATIPFQIHNNLIVIDVLLNRSLPLKFILDTGVRTTVLTEKTLSDLLNLEYSRKITIPGVGGEKLVDAFVVNNVSLNIGEIQGEGHALLVLEKDLLQLKNYLGVNVHGILGYELFSRFIVDIDYDKKQINFYRPGDFKKKSGYEELDITIEDTKPYLVADIAIRKTNGSGKRKFMIDTGASHSLLINTLSDILIECPEPNLESTLGRGLGGTIHGRVARVDRVQFDKFSFNGVIANFPDRTSYDVDFADNKRHGTFGGGMMSRFKTVFNYADGKLYLKKGRQYKTPFEFNLSGVIVKATGVYLREFEIDAVRENSAAADAGLMPGDTITHINGISVEKLTLDEVVGRLNVKENKRIRVYVRRRGERMVFNFRLKRLI